jgi:CBS domain-containing protein
MSNKQLVSEKALDVSKVPVISRAASLKEALDKMNEFRLGIALIVEADQSLVGVLTDGDLRRLLLSRQSPLPALLITPAIEFGSTNPKVVFPNTTMEEARAIMRDAEVWDLPVVSSNGVVVGLVHRHSLD